MAVLFLRRIGQVCLTGMLRRIEPIKGICQSYFSPLLCVFSVNAVMSGRDVLVIMAAGGGKSLSYQLPTLSFDTQDNDQRLTMLQLVEKLKTKIKNLDPELKREEMEQLVIQLILDRVLKEEFQHTAYSTNAYVALGPLAKQVAQGKKTIMFEIFTQDTTKDVTTGSGKRSITSSGLALKLDELRKEIASANEGLLPHSVLSTQQISMLSSEKPDTLEKLQGMIGKLKTDKYGVKILEEIKKYEDSPEQCLAKPANEQGDDHRAKKQKTRNTLVVIDSSEDDRE